MNMTGAEREAFAEYLQSLGKPEVNTDERAMAMEARADVQEQTQRQTQSDTHTQMPRGINGASGEGRRSEEHMMRHMEADLHHADRQDSAGGDHRGRWGGKGDVGAGAQEEAQGAEGRERARVLAREREREREREALARFVEDKMDDNLAYHLAQVGVHAHAVHCARVCTSTYMCAPLYMCAPVYMCAQLGWR